MRRLSGDQATCDSAAGVIVTRAASPPSFADAAKISPRAANATFLPSGESARSWNWFVSRRCSVAGPAGAPIRVIGDLGGGAGRRIELPDPEVALEHDRVRAGRCRRPQHPTVRELRDLPRLCAGRRRDVPDVLRAAAIRHEVERPSVAGPHRPQILGAAVGDRAPGRWRVGCGQIAQPDLRFVEMTVAVSPPLARCHPARGDREQPCRRARRAEKNSFA